MTAYVYRLYDADDALLYIGHTSDFERRMRYHLEPVTNRFARLPSADDIKARYHHHTLEPYADNAQADAAEREAIRVEAPLFNRFHNPQRWHRPDNRAPFVPVREDVAS